MNKDLKHDFYAFPKELKEKIKFNFNKASEKDNGYNRLERFNKDGGVNYGQAKKVKHELENGLEGEVYKLVGGDDLLDWLNDTLGNRRKTVDGIKRSKMNAGLPNQFKKPHDKDKSKNPTNVNVAKVQKSSDEIINNRTVYESITRIKDIIKKII
tara:strand:- start:188 stop:652 length:465 start_codon:yes stop_codon:yes gene_type:complete